MNATAALIAYSFVAIVLLRIERRRNPAASPSLWVPTLWMLVTASRPIGRWFETDPNYHPTASPLDQLMLTLLMVLALAIVIRRKMEWSRILRGNMWIIILFLYMGLSILWSEFPLESFKRWTKMSGALLMAVAILSEAHPLEAFESILRRIAYILVPLSIVLVKYSPVHGRAYGRWDGLEMWTGVATHKNGLGQLCAVSAVFLLWVIVREWRSGNPNGGSAIFVADLVVFATCLFLLAGPGEGTYSATSVAITFVGVVIVIALQWRRLARFIVSKIGVISVFLVGTYLLLGDSIIETTAAILDRNKDLTGRATDIWPVVVKAASEHPVLGAGYAGVWGLGREISAAVEVEQAHNGYLDVFLQLGLVGVSLIAIFLLAFCKNIRKANDQASQWGIVGIFILLSSLIYNNTESSFVEYTSYLWTTMVFFTVASSGTREVRVASRGHTGGAAAGADVAIGRCLVGGSVERSGLQGGTRGVPSKNTNHLS